MVTRTRRRFGDYRLVGAGVLASIAISAVGASAQTNANLLKPDPKNWLTYAGSYNAFSHTELSQITPQNAHAMQAKWAYHVSNAQELETTPIVYNGVMYISGYNRMDAIDARTGNVIWRYKRQPDSNTVQRGTAIYNGKLFIPTTDGFLVALDARNGSVVWETKVYEGKMLNGAPPFVAKGKVMVGTGSGAGGGTLSAYDAETGQHVWTWHSAPAAGAPGSETWENVPDPQKMGGAAIWRSGSFDPETNLLIWGTGSPLFWYAEERRKGDNLFVDSIVAIDVDTGELKWHFQNVPHDTHDWDSQETLFLIDAPFKGVPRQLVVQVHRDGFYYILDRTTGEFLLGTPFIDGLDWATGLTDKGRPILVPGKEPSLAGTKTCPPTEGATNWPTASYDPAMRLVFVHTVQGCNLIYRTSMSPGASGFYVEDEHNPWRSYLRAIDATTGKRVWEQEEIGSFHYGSGVISTATGVLFAPEQFGQVDVRSSKTGESLWHFNTGDLITASPVAYAVGGQQFFAVAAGTNVFAFGLPDDASVPGARK
jgi:alcohol dehydrogenase (cytochrome c)